jgi:uncharacterized membrane protein YhaH (DUF805 family)
MKGEVLNYDDNSGNGQISGSDGIRYSFTRADLKQLVPISKGTQVDFDFDGKMAKDIYVMEAAPPQLGYGGAQQGYAGGPPPRYTGPVEPDHGLWGYFTRTLTANYANFSGRARRKEYWGFVLFTFIVYLIFAAIMGAGAAATPRNPDGTLAGQFSPLFFIGAGLMGLYVLATLIPGLGLWVRRLHDIGWPGWIIVIALLISWIPVINIIVSIGSLVVACLDSQPFVNKYGPPPKQVA